MTTFIILVAALSLVVLLMKEYGWTDLTGNTRNDLVFEQRNKAYGAYEIRQKYSNRLIVAFFGMLVIMTTAAFAPKYLMKSEAVIINDPHKQGPDITIKEITKEEKVEQEVFEEPKEKPQEQPQQQPKNDISTAANTNPVATTKPLEQDTTQKDNNAVSSNTNHIGTDTLGNGSNIASTTGCINCGTTTEGNVNNGNGGGIQDEVTVQKRASFPGGIIPYLRKHIKYPDAASETGIEGKVYIEFIVYEDGSVKVSDIKRGVHPLLDNEAKRVINSMKGWQPAEINGKAVKVRMIQPVSFILQH